MYAGVIGLWLPLNPGTCGDIVAEISDKKLWPKLPDGTIDWEVVFEHPENGLVRLIEDASKSQTLIDCAATIIQSLFSRDGDEDVRAKYTQALAKVTSSGTTDVAIVGAQIQDILRGIKGNRVKAAAEWSAHKKQQSDERRRRHDTDIEFVFTDVFCDLFDRKLQVMWGGVTQQPLDGRKLPYTVSSDFARVFESVVRDVIVPAMTEKCRHIISEAGREKTADRRPYLENRLMEPKTQNQVWDIWKTAWGDLMVDKDPPKKPDAGKGGVFGMIKQVVNDAFPKEGAYTIDDWQRDADKIENHNRKAHDTRATLLAPSTIYEAPLIEDLDRLMNFYAIDSGELRKEISGIRQFAQEEDSAARNFESFSKGKDLELAIIAVSFQDPDRFLREPDPMLPHILGGKKDHELSRGMPLLMRALGHLL